MQTKAFKLALPRYTPETQELRDLIEPALIERLALYKEKKQIALTIRFDTYCDAETLHQLSAGIAKAYGCDVRIAPVFSPSAYSIAGVQALLDELAEESPACAHALSRCSVTETGGKVQLIAEGGAEVILASLGCVEALARKIGERFGVRREVVCVAGTQQQDEKKLKDYEAKLLAEEKRAAPPPPPQPQQQQQHSAPKRDRAQPQRRTPRPPAPTDIPEENILIGQPFGEPSIPISDLPNQTGRIAIEGKVFAIDTREIQEGRSVVINMDVTDKKGSVRVKRILPKEDADLLLQKVDAGKTYLRIRGEMEYDRFYEDYTMKPIDLYIAKEKIRPDNAEKKRVELHMHTSMSRMDGVSSAHDLIDRAMKWGHTAIAVTDHGVTQGYPEALHTANGIKVLYGMEGYFVNDMQDITIVRGSADEPLDGEFICFDIESTGTNPQNDAITEIAAVLVRNGEIVDTFQTYTNPGRPIPAFITELTGISDATVANAVSPAEGVRAFRAFCGNRIVVAHNAQFDTSFVEKVAAEDGAPWDMTFIDTLELSRTLLPDLPRHKLNVVAEGLKLPEFRHHSASEDTRILALIFIEFLRRMKDMGIERVQAINSHMSDRRRENVYGGAGLSALPVRHIILIAKNRTGLVNLYRLVSYGHLKYMNRRKQPIVPRHELDKYREGLIVGSACEAGELFRAMLDGKSHQELKKIARYYDFLEIQPLGNNEFLTRSGYKKSKTETVRFTHDDLINFNRTIVKLGDELNIPVVATGDVHFLDQDDAIYRAVIMTNEGFPDADEQAPLYLRTTEEMLAEFDYLGPKKAYEVVVENTNKIANRCETVKPFPDGLYPPELPGSAEELRNLTWTRAHKMYGDPLPEIVQNLVQKELDAIIGHGFDVMYMFAQKLIARSEENGYVVGSRGSVGSSIVAFFSGITEVNALPPHYRCPNCQYSEFHPECDCGPDMPNKDCPNCGTHMIKDGYDIPFATFLGFDGDKDPDIDLNFSSEYQAKAHQHTIELFGEDNVFRAGTISTVAEATAYGYVKSYEEKTGKKFSKTDEARIAAGCVGVKRTTGQHPGGLIVVPKGKEIYEFCPVCHPADKTDADTIITHVDYHSIDTNLLKFDLLGKDDPTVLRYLEDNSGIPFTDVPLDDRQVLDLFTTNAPLKIQGDAITGKNGALGIPEFGTSFVRAMLDDAKPKSVGDLIRISGISHGTDVWLGNAEVLIKEMGMKLEDCICCRDDIMNYLISVGMDPKLSFTIMEKVRKPKRLPDGKKLTAEWEQAMLEHGVPQWYLDSCNKISYMFPKAHATAYVLMAIRIAWYKVYHPLAYYGSFFSIKAVALDNEAMIGGDDAVLRKLAEINQIPSGKMTQNDKELRRTLEIAHEYYLRGFKFLPVDIYDSEPAYFKVYPAENALRLPFRAIPGLGDIAAAEIAEERKKGPFSSIEEFSARCRRSSLAITDALRMAGAFGAIPSSSQFSLFEL